MFEAEFETWWSGCWLKVGKLAAKQAYVKARKQHGATAEELIAGRDAYMQHKPAWQEWAHPRTWLCQGRWEDAWPGVKLPRTSPRGYVDWFEECKTTHGGACGLDRWKHMTRVQAEQGR